MRSFPVAKSPCDWSAWLVRVSLLGVMVSGLGCAGVRGFALRRPEGPYGRGTPCALTAASSAEEVVALVNRNVEKLEGWRASSVRIRAQGIPMSLDGNLVVQRDHRLRLEVTSPRGKEVDFGSNDEEFWLWSKPQEKLPNQIYYAAHQDMDLARQHLPFPFEPEWLMEALGVAPYSAEGATVEPVKGGGSLRLVSHHQLPTGETVKKVVVVHGCHGYVMEHSTYDERNQPLVRVLLQDYRLDAGSGAILPRHVKLDWPQNSVSLAMDLGHVEVNPTAIPVAVWRRPPIANAQMVNLGDPRLASSPLYASRRPVSRPGRPARDHSQPPAFATTGEDLDRFMAPSFEPADQVGVTAATEPAFEQPIVEFREPEFETPALDDPAGRAVLEAPQAIEPF